MKECAEREQVMKTIQQHGGVFSTRFTPDTIELVPLEPNYIMKSELSPGHPVYSFRFILDSDNLAELQDISEYEIRVAYKPGDNPLKKSKPKPIRHHYTQKEELLILEYVKNNPGPVASISYWNHALRNGLDLPHSAWSLKHHYYRVMPAKNLNPKDYQPAKIPKKRIQAFSFKKSSSVEEVPAVEFSESQKKKPQGQTKTKQISLQETLNKSPEVLSHSIDFRTPAPAPRQSPTQQAVSIIAPIARPQPQAPQLSIVTQLTPQPVLKTPQSAASRVSASSGGSNLKRKADESTPYRESKRFLIHSRLSSSAKSQGSEMSDLLENRVRGFSSEIDNTNDICIIVSGNERKVIDMSSLRNRFVQEGFAQEFLKLVRVCRHAAQRDLREEEVLRALMDHQGNARRTVEYYSLR